MKGNTLLSQIGKKATSTTPISSSVPTLMDIIDKDVHINSASNLDKSMPKKPRQATRPKIVKWDKGDTQTFLKCLEMFGTDFSFIAKFFPDRTRAQMVKKYKRQQRINPDTVSKAISQNENRRITRHLKLKQTSVIKMESMESNKSLDSTDRRLCKQVKEMINFGDKVLTRSESQKSQKSTK